MKRPRRRDAVPAEDPPPCSPIHKGSGCSRCVAWRAAQKLGLTLAEFCQLHRHAYSNDLGDHAPFVVSPEDFRASIGELDHHWARRYLEVHLAADEPDRETISMLEDRVAATTPEPADSPGTVPQLVEHNPGVAE